jgi:cellulose synthase/poly-beta-1,6-N-acetylglucosamine synthase-like glycosyltransferase
MLILFCICLATIAYVYFGYPLLLRFGAIGRCQSFRRGSAQPLVSIIVAAHNEELCIEAKLQNLLAQDYPRERVEILIGSDGSSDRTEEIVRRFAGEGVGLVSFPKQHGKSTMQNSLVAFATAELLAFTDADCLLPPSALSLLVENFADPRVGLASACPRFRNASETAVAGNESRYLRYETWLRRRESERGVLAMASGSLFAMRRSLWKPLAPHFGDDFVLPLQVIRAGMSNRIDARVLVVTDLAQNRPRSMLRMKARIIGKDFRALLAHRDLLNPVRHGGVAVALWSHKLLRWLIPYFLLALLASNSFLLHRPLFRGLFAPQASFYAFAFVGFRFRSRPGRLVFSAPMSFCIVNFAALIGTLNALAGRVPGRWKPDRKAPPKVAFRPAAPPREVK